MKLETNMYVRTKDGIITKIIDNRDNVIIKTDDYTTHLRSKVIKASFNIIDLIEVGDYVNGCKVHKIANCITIILDNEENISWVNPSDIKSIVTKEQFQKMEYRIGDE